MIVDPKLVISLLSIFKQKEKLRGQFYKIYEDLLTAYDRDEKECAQLVNTNAASLNVLLSEDLIGVVLSLLVDVDKSALEVSPHLKGSISKGVGNCSKELKTIAYAGGVPLDSKISQINQIGEAAKAYVFSSKLEESDKEEKEIQAIATDEHELAEDEKAFEQLVKNIRQNLGESDAEDDTQELSAETLSSLASVMATTAKADKTEFVEGDILPDSIDLDSDDLSYVATTTEAILTRYEMMLRPMLELDSPYGILYKDGLSTIEFDKSSNSIKFKQGSNKSVFKIIYDEVNKFFGNKLVSGSLLNRPTVDNVQLTGGYNYYPAMMLKFALGFANGKRHYNWDTFKKAAKEEITKRVGVLAKAGLFPQMTRRIQESFSNCILVTTCGNHGSNLIMRICIANVDINANGLADMLKNNPNLSYFNSQIIVEKVGNDVVDVKIIGDMQALLDVPTWAYQALQKQINSGNQLDAYSGLPIGKSFEGDIIKLTFIPSDDFITVIGAGSRSGKGVTTLSVLGAALNSSLGVLYNDFKPDMAKCFWDAEKQFPGLHTFAMDGLTMQGRADKNGKVFIPKDGFPEYAGKYKVYGGLLMMLKSIHLMCAVAQYKTEHGDETPLLWVFDEIQAWQTTLCAFAEMLGGISAPKKNEEPNPLYDYAQKILEFIADTDSGLKNYITTTGGKGGVFTLWICQNTDAGAWNSIRVTSGKRQLPLFGAINKAGTMRKILGRGNTIGQYALGGLKGEHRFRNQLNYVANNRFFCMFRGSQTDKNTDAQFFKPFLTLNTDDIYDGCWTKGIGKSYGYKPKNKDESDEAYRNRVLNKYESTLQTVLPGNNKYGVSAGTGFVGLVGTYCNQDEQTIIKGLSAGYEYLDRFLQESGLGQRYSSIEEYLYDFSETGFPSIGDLQDYTKSESFRGGSGEELGEGLEGPEGSGDFTMPLGDGEGLGGSNTTGASEPAGNAGNTNSSFENSFRSEAPATPPMNPRDAWSTFMGRKSENPTPVNEQQSPVNTDINLDDLDFDEPSSEGGVEDLDSEDLNTEDLNSEDLNSEDLVEATELGRGPNEYAGEQEDSQIQALYNQVLDKVKNIESMISAGQEVNMGDDPGGAEHSINYKSTEDEDIELKRALQMQAELNASLVDMLKILSLAPRPQADHEIKEGNVIIKKIAKEEMRDNVALASYQNAVRSEYNYTKPTLFKKIMSWCGAKEYDKNIFKMLMSDLGTHVNLKKARTLELTEDSMAVDGRAVFIPGQYGSDYGLVDFIDFKILFKRVPGLQAIHLSQLMFREMMRSTQLGENAAIKVFDIEKDLLRLFYTDPMTGKEVSLDRSSVKCVDMQKKLNSLKREKELREMMEEQSLLASDMPRGRHVLSQIKKAVTSTKSKEVAKKLCQKAPYAVGFTFGIFMFPLVAVGMVLNHAPTIAKKIVGLAGN